jgi:hypothetical protein
MIPDALTKATLSYAEAAKELGMSVRWLRDWLARYPADAKGVPFYLLMGRKKVFEPADIGRIRAQIRENEKCRLSSTGKGESFITAERLARLATGKGFADRATPRTAIARRARLPKSSGDTGKVLCLDRKPY